MLRCRSPSASGGSPCVHPGWAVGHDPPTCTHVRRHYLDLRRARTRGVWCHGAPRWAAGELRRRYYTGHVAVGSRLSRGRPARRRSTRRRSIFATPNGRLPDRGTFQSPRADAADAEFLADDYRAGCNHRLGHRSSYCAAPPRPDSLCCGVRLSGRAGAGCGRTCCRTPRSSGWPASNLHLVFEECREALEPAVVHLPALSWVAGTAWDKRLTARASLVVVRLRGVAPCQSTGGECWNVDLIVASAWSWPRAALGSRCCAVDGGSAAGRGAARSACRARRRPPGRTSS